jgi:hypothetical protein
MNTTKLIIVVVAAASIYRFSPQIQQLVHQGATTTAETVTGVAAPTPAPTIAPATVYERPTDADAHDAKITADNMSIEGARLLVEAARVNAERSAQQSTPVIATPSGLDTSQKSALDDMFDNRARCAFKPEGPEQ